MYPLSHCITKHVVCPFSWLISPATHERERVHHRALTVIFHILCDSLSQVLLHASLSFFSQAALHRNVHSGPIAKTILYLWGIELLVFCAFFLRKMAQKTIEKIPRSCTFCFSPLCNPCGRAIFVLVWWKYICVCNIVDPMITRPRTHLSLIDRSEEVRFPCPTGCTTK